MIVGLPVNGMTNGSATPLSPYQALAADFDGDGKVSLTDAIGVLKHVVGLSAPSPTWNFVYELDSSLASITDLAPGLAKTTLTADLSGTSTSHVGMVAYLSGDVDGSFAGATGVVDLDIVDPSYLPTLMANHAILTAAQFGIDTVLAVPAINSVSNSDIVNAQASSIGVVISGTADTGVIVNVNWESISKTVTAVSGAWSTTYAVGQIPVDGASTLSVLH